MKKTVGSVATDLQTIAHEGHSQDCVYVKLLDAIYKIKGIHQEIIKREGKETNVFFIDIDI